MIDEMKAKMEELAKEYENSCWILSPYKDEPDSKESFKHGFAARDQLAEQELSKYRAEMARLVEALNTTKKWLDGSADCQLGKISEEQSFNNWHKMNIIIPATLAAHEAWLKGNGG